MLEYACHNGSSQIAAILPRSYAWVFCTRRAVLSLQWNSCNVSAQYDAASKTGASDSRATAHTLKCAGLGRPHRVPAACTVAWALGAVAYKVKVREPFRNAGTAQEHSIYYCAYTHKQSFASQPSSGARSTKSETQLFIC